MSSVLLESKQPFRTFLSGEEYLVAMKEDLAEWLQSMYPALNINFFNFMEKLETGVALCEHANAVKFQATEYVEKKRAKRLMTRSVTGSLVQAEKIVHIQDVRYFGPAMARPGTFFARDNLSNFINWSRNSLEIIECLLFESDDLILRKNEKHVLLCLLEVARRGAKFGMLAPIMVQMERQIDREIAADQKKLGESIHQHQDEGVGEDEEDDSDLEDEEPMLMYGPVPQIVTNDLKSLDEMVRDLVEKCNCPTQFPMIRVSEGKYRIGDTKVLIFVRILRNHVMVRVGGGWDTLSHYLDKHDPCRCRAQHRSTLGALHVRRQGAADLHGSHVYYDRQAAAVAATGSPQGGSPNHLGPPVNALNRSRSRSPSLYGSRRSVSPGVKRGLAVPSVGRSRSPTPNFTSTHQTKLVAPKRIVGKVGKHVATMQIPLVARADVATLKTEANLQLENLTDQSDTTSEMSDEGYRSLGLVQDKGRQRSSLYSQNSTEDADFTEHPHTDGIEDVNDIGLRKTSFSQKIYETRPPVSRGPSPAPSPKISTWSGRPKKARAPLTSDTFTRGAPTRRSVSGSPRPSQSAATSPTKSIREDLLDAVSRAPDEETVLRKVEALLREYTGGPFNPRMSIRSPRKDKRNENHLSRIPAPVPHS